MPHHAAAPARTPSAKPPAGINADAIEQDVLRQWEQEHTFERSVKQREGSPRYTFYDGPPYATGVPHYGHVLQTTIKDTVTRYWTMRGYRVERRVGWDCHGLPIEHLVEKELGIKNKRDIEVMGVETFNAACRAAVFRSVADFQAVLKRMGRWADYAHAFSTLDASYMETVWWVFAAAWDAGLVYNGFRSSPYCPRCATTLSNFETSLGYKETEDPAIIVKLRLADAESTFLLVWTTLPWTLPANVAVAVKPDLRYLQVKVSGEHWIVAKNRLQEVVDTAHALEEEYSGNQLVGRRYEPLYQFLVPEKEAFRVVAAPFVSETEGTGLVHLAPAFGADDLAVAEVENLPILKTVDEYGAFTNAVTPWAGLFVKDADEKIIHDLEERSLIVRREPYRHQYPFCWRCETPLISYATNSWFIAVSRLRKQLLENNERIQWVPEHLQRGRFGQGLRDAPDWAVSRSRYWGTPMPVWQCVSCGKHTVVGSVKELAELGADLAPLRRGGDGGELDLHRPYIDAVTFACPACGSETQRIPDVFDVWMDSGSMPYAQWHYPFEHRRQVEESFPADFIAEALDQTRGWFYTLHVLAALLTSTERGLGVGQPAFRHAVVSGLVLAGDGKKLSKRLKNFPAVLDVVQKFGADTLRLYLLSQTTIGEDYRVSERLLEGFYRAFTLPLFNILSFYETYARFAGWKPGSAPPQAGPAAHILDQWITAELSRLTREVRQSMDAYRVDQAAKALVAFVDGFSNWYVRRSRGRFAVPGDSADRRAALATLETVLTQYALLLAPFAPFFAEALCRRAGHPASPHLADFPEAGAADASVLTLMESLKEIVSAALQARARAGVKVRQPLHELVIVGSTSVPVERREWRELLCEEVNVKRVRSAAEKPREGEYRWIDLPGGVSVGLDVAMDEELRQEGIIRDLIRQTQELRKRAGLTRGDRIELAVSAADSLVRQAVERLREMLLAETRAVSVGEDLQDATAESRVSLRGSPVTLRLKKAP